MKEFRRFIFTSVVLCIAGILVSCEKGVQTEPKPEAEIQSSELISRDFSSANTALIEAGAIAIQESGIAASTLQTSIDDFLAAPTQENLVAAQKHWINAILAYRQFSFFRHIGLVEPNHFSKLNRLDYQIAYYPIQPGYLDRFGEYKYSGLVFDIGFPLNEESLSHHHGLTDLSDAALGLYAIEFLLFNKGEPRAVSDFEKLTNVDKSFRERGFEKPEELPNNRRRELLRLQASILNRDLTRLADHWRGATEDSAASSLASLSNEDIYRISRKSLENTLSQIILEIGELNKKEGDYIAVSDGIRLGYFSNKQLFIQQALKSALVATAFLEESKKEKIESFLSQAINKTETDSLKENESMTDYWREVFTPVKEAFDFLLLETP